MTIDIIGSPLTQKLTQFKNFPFKVGNFISGQSMLSLVSEPYNADMADLDTEQLDSISTAYRDLNKTFYHILKDSNSDVLILDILSELNEVSMLEENFYNKSSLELLKSHPAFINLSQIQKFRLFQKHLDAIVGLLDKYEKIIILKPGIQKGSESEFLNALYALIQNRLSNHLVLSVPRPPEGKTYFKAPVEYYDGINSDLKKFTSDNYHNQLLFEEKLEDDKLTLFINHIEEREYIYELYKDGSPYKSTQPTTSRFCQFKLTDEGKYRVRVHLTDASIKPRFSQTYIYSPITENEDGGVRHVEMPRHSDQWMLDYVLEQTDIESIVGNPFKYPNGYKDMPVVLPEEIETDNILYKDQIFDHIVHDVMSKNANSENLKHVSPKYLFKEFIEEYVKKSDN
ncbi:DUF6270 domain-containing protein [Salinicoccus albus]|uniref:DUF6270 domain-containing protein n=1 Tax=Salinicoccus albus TaxID=418756 RepID=UPI0003790679|nr:DUF6270 domain-containing protein [Salinicoccus albus]